MLKMFYIFLKLPGLRNGIAVEWAYIRYVPNLLIFSTTGCILGGPKHCQGGQGNPQHHRALTASHPRDAALIHRPKRPRMVSGNLGLLSLT